MFTFTTQLSTFSPFNMMRLEEDPREESIKKLLVVSSWKISHMHIELSSFERLFWDKNFKTEKIVLMYKTSKVEEQVEEIFFR